MPYDVLVQVMDAVRFFEAVQDGQMVQAELFPDISIGDAPLRELQPGRLNRGDVETGTPHGAPSHARTKKGSALNLVSMMDIFTILVFFLLVNSAETEVLPNPKEIQLPESAALEKARESVVVMVTDDQMLVQGRPVTTVAAALAGDELVIPDLKVALRQQTDRVLIQQAKADIAAREVTILGDRELPYRLLKRVMASCTAADFGQISLAVVQKDGAPPPQVAAL